MFLLQQFIPKTCVFENDNKVNFTYFSMKYGAISKGLLVRIILKPCSFLSYSLVFNVIIPLTLLFENNFVLYCTRTEK